MREKELLRGPSHYGIDHRDRRLVRLRDDHVHEMELLADTWKVDLVQKRLLGKSRL